MVMCTVYCFCKPANVGKFVKGPPPDPLEIPDDEEPIEIGYEQSDSDIRRFLCINSPRPVRQGEKSVEFYGQ
jgi:hypothetical protein